MSKKYVFLSKKMFKILKQSSGFSLIEIIVAMGIMSVVAGLFATSVVQLQKSQVNFEDKNASFSFISALTGSLLGDQQTCTALLHGIRIGTNPVEFTISNFSGLGSNTIDLKKNTVISGESATNAKVRIQGLTINAKPNVQTTKVVASGVTYDRKIAVITLATEIRSPGDKKSGQDVYRSEAPRIFEVPVYVNAGSVIQSCQVNMTRSDVCDTMGGNVDPSNTSKCKPREQCYVRGSYFTSVCRPAYGGCTPSSPNPITGGLSCPTNSTATSTGMYSQTFTISCGKKCSYIVTNTLEYFICMQCD